MSSHLSWCLCVVVSYLLLLVYQASEGREYLLSLEQDAAWISSRVLPFLAEGSREEADEEGPGTSQLAARIVEV